MASKLTNNSQFNLVRNNPADYVGIVVNYYSRPSFSKHHRTITTLCLQSLKETSGLGEIVLVDGSTQSDQEIREICEREMIKYIHTGSELSYSEGFNVGFHQLNEKYIGLVANDIMINQESFDNLWDWVKIPGVGCAFPYLSFSDYPGQMPFFVRKPVSCEPTCMTLNINLFPRNVLEEIGGVDESYSGSYNDVIMLTKIRNSGYRVVLVGNTNVVHLGKTTITQGSDYKKDEDFLRFSEEYPQFRAKHGKWQIKHWVKPFAINKRIAAFWWISQNLPSTRLRKFMEWLTLWLEPELTKTKNNS